MIDWEETQGGIGAAKIKIIIGFRIQVKILVEVRLNGIVE